MKLRRVISGLLLATLLCIMLPLGVLAADGTTTTTPAPETTTTVVPPTISLKTDFPKMEVISGSTISFQVKIVYTDAANKNAKEFDLIVAVPEGWTGYVNNSTGTRIASINLDPTSVYGTTVTVYGSPTYTNPSPGDYKISLQATSGDLIGNIDVTAVVTAQYSMSIAPSGTSPVYSTSATAGKETVYSVTLQNNGSAAIENVSLSYSAPANWVVTFPTLTIDSLAAGENRMMDVKIKPAEKAIAGDYMITLTASGKPSITKNIDIRVRVSTPSALGIVGIIVIVIVIAGLVFVFMRFSRR